ncbi:hypothetical protein AMAG_08277 [Allomyces macrogynus ATCC 38327]|uniref:RIIa domain-containing protein n=1 Tax=Allomyces macrogynus (strain ATCC 38327) TaxID=578462 RepID=A0A0L0SKM9_ALLM3|nr:hypothetical protein AMAG_08277 [Allomyces macrogynus ATCC 38327]|eukprot:KNE63111.1 hypothetical protein AMAG_08277 [Allomyces macrogynus ATCC 38327]
MDPAPTPPDGGQWDRLALACPLQDVTSELLASLADTDVLLAPLLQTCWSLALHDAVSKPVGKLSLEIQEDKVGDVPCYLVLLTVSAHVPHAATAKPEIWSLQLVAHVSSTLDTIQEKLLVAAGKRFRQARSVWQVDGEYLVQLTTSGTDFESAQPQTFIVPKTDCPGLLFQGAELIMHLLVALHLDATLLSVPEIFQYHVLTPDWTLHQVTLQSDPPSTHLFRGRARKLVGIWLTDPAGSPSNAAPTRPSMFLLAPPGAQLYFDHARDLDLTFICGVWGCLTAEPSAAPVASAGAVVAVGAAVAEEGGEAKPQAHPADLPDFGGEIELQSKFFEFKSKEEASFQSLLAKRPELSQVLTDFTRALLAKKPVDVLAFAMEYFAVVVD